MVYHNLKDSPDQRNKGLARPLQTVADERALIQQESAAIRASFREEDVYARHNNIAKLLYIHMLGSPAHFGQIECLKLVASPRFTDKRLGYLGIMLLLDENQEVLTLVTNSLKNDMNHSNMYVVGLGLCTFANIASEEMSRDLANEIEKLLGSSNTYIRKKAALCALRVIKKVPDLSDHFISKAKNLLTDRNHGIDENCLNEFRNAVPLLVRNLKALVTTGYSPEHDVSGITDPFLQVKVLRLLRLLGRGDARASETMNDILAQVATNTDSTKNVGNSILYETVLTILEIEADSGLRVMAINILGKFLGNRDNNIRYVALNTLNKVVGMDTNAVQRHRNIILDCLRDGDISIRRRALELSYALINEQNVRILIRELLAFLEVADDEFKLGMTTQISLAAERFAPNKRWHIDTVLRVLKLASGFSMSKAGNFVREEILSAFIRLVAHTPELQAYTSSKLYTALQDDISQESLTLAALWVIGEYGDVLFDGGVVDEDQPKQITDKDLFDLLLTTLDSPYANSLIRQFLMASITKLASRPTTSSPQQQRIAEILAKYTTSPELELQQRAVEFASLFTLGDLRSGVLERMPPPELKATVMGIVSENKPVGSTQGGKDVDLLGDEVAPPTPVVNGQATHNNQDLLAEIFGSSPAVPSSTPGLTPSTSPQPQKSSVQDILGLFDSSPSPALSAPAPSSTTSAFTTFSPQPQSQAPPQPSPQQQHPPAPRLTSYTAYDKQELKITLTPQTSAARPGVVNIMARFQVSGSNAATGLNFQAAVPKSQQLQMLPMSNSDVQPGTTETQQMRVMAPPGSNIRLRLRISYTLAGQAVQDQIDFSGFPPGLTGSG
ncbi:adaptin N terminal region-domain-containing protein [Suillus subluteus]|nr:adaptin N terminal region-domain-containing protein [Suillus subluteus]